LRTDRAARQGYGPGSAGNGASEQRMARCASTTQGVSMNKNQVKGALKDAAGKLQETAGEVIGNPEQQLKGIKKQVEGKAQRAVGDVQEVVKTASNK
jgi:uncharacterized protein YjbJ (UPF0337 family)